MDAQQLQGLAEIPCEDQLAAPPLFQETLAAITSLKNGKACGPDGVPVEVIKSCRLQQRGPCMKQFVKFGRGEERSLRKGVTPFLYHYLSVVTLVNVKIGGVYC